MMSLLTILPLQAEAEATSSMGGGMQQMIFIGLIFVVMYFFMIRPQQKKQKELARFRASIAKGDKVVTAGGIYGKVKDVNEGTVVVEIANNVDITIDKAMIVRDPSDMAK